MGMAQDQARCAASPAPAVDVVRSIGSGGAASRPQLSGVVVAAGPQGPVMNAACPAVLVP